MDKKHHPICENCEQSLVGSVPVAVEDGPLDVGDKIPKNSNSELYEREIGYVCCDGCERKIRISPKEYWNPPDKL